MYKNSYVNKTITRPCNYGTSTNLLYCREKGSGKGLMSAHVTVVEDVVELLPAVQAQVTLPSGAGGGGSHV